MSHLLYNIKRKQCVAAKKCICKLDPTCRIERCITAHEQENRAFMDKYSMAGKKGGIERKGAIPLTVVRLSRIYMPLGSPTGLVDLWCRISAFGRLRLIMLARTSSYTLFFDLLNVMVVGARSKYTFLDLSLISPQDVRFPATSPLASMGAQLGPPLPCHPKRRHESS